MLCFFLLPFTNHANHILSLPSQAPLSNLTHAGYSKPSPCQPTQTNAVPQLALCCSYPSQSMILFLHQSILPLSSLLHVVPSETVCVASSTYDVNPHNILPLPIHIYGASSKLIPSCPFLKPHGSPTLYKANLLIPCYCF